MFDHLIATLTHPLALPIIGITGLMLLAFIILSTVSPETLPKPRRLSESGPLNALAWLGAILLIPGTPIFLAALWELFVLAWAYPPLDTPASEIRWHASLMLAMLAAIGAIFTLVFAFIKVFTTERQTRTAEEQARHNDRVLFNQKFDAAAAGLHAQRQVTIVVGDEHRTVWEDDVIKRNGAIDRLEELVEENSAAASRVARMLSVYLRELSREFPAKEAPKEATPKDIRQWAQGLTPARSDMEKAAQTLGRLKMIAGTTLSDGLIDLRDANLQGFALRGLSFDKARLGGAQLQGANLYGAQLQGASLDGAQLQGASLNRTQLQGASLYGAQLQGSSLSRTQLQGASLDGAQLQGANLYGAQLQGAGLDAAQLQGANLYGAQMDAETSLSAATLRGAALRDVDFNETTISKDQIDAVFGDYTVKLPPGSDAPERFMRSYKDWNEFNTAWRTWQKEIGFDPNDPSTWDGQDS